MSEVLDTQALAELRDIMEDDFADLMETFLSESARQYAEAREAWGAGEFETLRRAAHSLKGSCGNVGAQTLRDTCADLEYSAKDQVLDRIPQLLDTAASQLQEVSSLIRAL